MWTDIERFLEQLLRQYGLWRVLTGPFLLIGLVGGFGLITNRGAASIVAVSLAFFISIVLIAFFAMQWKITRLKSSERARLLTRYAEHFIRQSGVLSFSIKNWDENTVVSKNGDAVIERRITLAVGERDLYSCWTANYSTTDQEMSESRQRRVIVQARSIDESGELGARYDVTHQWEGSRQRVFVHLEDPAPAGSEVKIWVKWSWPAFCEALLNGGTERFEWFFNRPVESVRAEIKFDPSCKVGRKFPMTVFPGSPAPEQDTPPDGSVVVKAAYDQLTVGTKVGFRLDSREAKS